MTSTLVTGIAELVTNDPDRPGLARAGRGRRSGGRRRARGVGRARAPRAGCRPVARRRRARGAPRVRRLPLPPVFAGDRSAEFAARMAGQRVRRRRDRSTVAATRAADDEELARRLDALLAEMRAPGHHDRRDQERVRPDRRGRGPPAARRRRVTDETTFLGAHVVPPEYAADRARVRRPGHRSDAGRLRPARPLDRRLLRAGAPRRSTATRPGPCSRPASPPAWPPRARQPARPRARRPARGRARAPPASTTARTSTTRTSTPCAGSSTVATLLPGVEFSTRSPYPDARRLLDAGVTVALATDCNPGRATRRRCRSSSRSRCARWA